MSDHRPKWVPLALLPATDLAEKEAVLPMACLPRTLAPETRSSFFHLPHRGVRP